MYIVYHEIFPSHGATAPSEPEPYHYRDFTITLRHTALGKNKKRDRPDAEASK